MYASYNKTTGGKIVRGRHFCFVFFFVFSGRLNTYCMFTPYLAGRSQSVLPFSKLNKIFLGYFDPENIFLDNKNK